MTMWPNGISCKMEIITAMAHQGVPPVAVPKVDLLQDRGLLPLPALAVIVMEVKGSEHTQGLQDTDCLTKRINVPHVVNGIMLPTTTGMLAPIANSEFYSMIIKASSANICQGGFFFRPIYGNFIRGIESLFYQN